MKRENEMEINGQRVSLQQDYVFGSVIANPLICLKLLRLILPDLMIENIEMVERQKVADDKKHSHGVRYDIYCRDSQQNIYDIEMQVQNLSGLPQRARYYHSKMDSDNLKKKQDYRLLKNPTLSSFAYLTRLGWACISTNSNISAY